MRRSLFTALGACVFTFASPIARQSLSLAEIDALNLALYLENLEYALYHMGCAQLNSTQFINAGFGSTFNHNVCRIAQQEAAHAKAISTILESNGITPMPACIYKFTFSGPTSFVGLANYITSVGIGAYLGSAEVLANNAAVEEVSASILSVEARHDAFLRSGMGASPFPSNFDTALTALWAYNLAQPFIMSCPGLLPGVTALPRLNLTLPAPVINASVPIAAGTTLRFSWDPATFFAGVWGPVAPFANGTSSPVPASSTPPFLNTSAPLTNSSVPFTPSNTTTPTGTAPLAPYTPAAPFLNTSAPFMNSSIPVTPTNVTISNGTLPMPPSVPLTPAAPFSNTSAPLANNSVPLTPTNITISNVTLPLAPSMPIACTVPVLNTSAPFTNCTSTPVTNSSSTPSTTANMTLIFIEIVEKRADPSSIPLYIAIVNQNASAPSFQKVQNLNSTAGTGSVSLPAGINGIAYACLTTFSGGLTLDQLSSYGTLAGPVQIVVS